MGIFLLRLKSQHNFWTESPLISVYYFESKITWIKALFWGSIWHSPKLSIIYSCCFRSFSMNYCSILKILRTNSRHPSVFSLITYARSSRGMKPQAKWTFFPQCLQSFSPHLRTLFHLGLLPIFTTLFLEGHLISGTNFLRW